MKVPHKVVGAAVILNAKNQILIAQRNPEKGMLAGLWEFPGGKQEPGETLEACLQREIREELGVAVVVGRRLVSVAHAYTHFRITIHAFECRYRGGRLRPLGVDAFRWILPGELNAFAFPAAVTTRETRSRSPL